MFDRIIWDWNGTILDDLDICINSINPMLKARELSVFTSVEDYYKKVRWPIEEYYRDIGFDFLKEPFDVLAAEFMSRYDALLSTCPLQRGAVEAFEAFKRAGIPQIIISACEISRLKKSLKDFDIDRYFDEVVGLDDIYAHGKKGIAEEWLRRTSADTSHSLYIGDTTHDFETAEVLGCKALLVAVGHNGRKQLEPTGADIVDNLYQATEYVLKG